jgi:hypothetical protein
MLAGEEAIVIEVVVAGARPAMQAKQWRLSRKFLSFSDAAVPDPVSAEVNGSLASLQGRIDRRQIVHGRTPVQANTNAGVANHRVSQPASTRRT